MAPEVERQSLTGSNPPHAGSGLGTKQTSLLGLLLEYRGLSWSIGGDEDLSTVTAFANILRNFNPSLTSFSTGMGSATTKQAFLNQASPAAMSQHLPSQTRALITRMKSDSRIDFQNDWKVITLFIGANDLCAFCTDPVFYSADNFMRNIREALDMLQHEVPRALVNLMELVNIGLARQLLQDCSLSCPTWMLRFECPCLMRTLDRSSELQAFTEMFEAYQASESQVCVRTRCGEQKVMNTARFPVGLGSPSGLGGFMLVFACD